MADRKPVIPRKLAAQDVEDAIAHHLREPDTPTAAKFVDALEMAFEQIGRYPAIGSTRWAVDLDIPGLRHWQVAPFPHLVFYLERPDHIDVWRVLHGRRDIPTWMQGQADA